MNKLGRKLRVHRESLRVLTDEGLAWIAGGTECTIGPPKASMEDPPADTYPRTNAWTGDVNYVC